MFNWLLILVYHSESTAHQPEAAIIDILMYLSILRAFFYLILNIHTYSLIRTNTSMYAYIHICTNMQT